MEKPGGLVTGIQPTALMYFVIFSKRTAFFKFEDVFPECFLYRKDSPLLDPLVCMWEENSCHVGRNCMETLVKRLHVLFEEILQEVDMVLLYYRKRSDPSSLGAGVFWRNLQDFKVLTLNRSAWSMIKNRGQIFQFQPGVSFFLTGSAAPPETPDSSEEVVLD